MLDLFDKIIVRLTGSYIIKNSRPKKAKAPKTGKNKRNVKKTKNKNFIIFLALVVLASVSFL